MKSPTEEPGLQIEQATVWVLTSPQSQDKRLTELLSTPLASSSESVPLMTLSSYWFYTHLCLFDRSFFKKSCSCGCAGPSLIFPLWYSFLCYYLAGFGHFWHIWWACSRSGSVPSLNMQELSPYCIKYYIWL